MDYSYRVIGPNGYTVFSCMTLEEAEDYAKLHPAFTVTDDRYTYYSD